MVDIPFPTAEDVKKQKHLQSRQWHEDQRRRYPLGSKYHGRGNIYGGRDELKPRHHKGMTFEPVAVSRNKPGLYRLLEKYKIAYTNYYRIYPVKAPPKGVGPYKYRGYVLYVGKEKISHGRIVKKPSRGQHLGTLRRRYERSLIRR